MKPKWSSVFDEEDDDEGQDYSFEGEEDNNMVLENEDFEIVDENEESSGNNQTLEEEIRRQEFQGDVEQQNINNEDENVDESSCIPPAEFEGQHHQGLETDQLIMEEFTEEDEEQETLIMEEEGNDLVVDDSLNHTVGFQSEVVYSDGEEEEELGYFEPLIDEIRKPFDPKTINIARLPTEKRHSLNERHPKFRDLNNMQIIQRMVTKGKVVNPADDEDEDDMHFSMMEENILLKKGIAIRKEFRKPEDRNGNEIMVSKNNQSCTLYLGGGIPLEPVLAHPKLNDEVERFRKELAKHRKEWSTVSFLHPKKRAWKVDPSSIVPASVSGSTGSSSIGSETDPECLATDDESETELMPGSIAAWIVPDATGSRSPSPAEPEFEVEEPEFIITTAGSHSNEPPAKKRKQKHEPQPHIDGKIYPKPGFSYSCLIAMSLKNSKTGCLPVSEIYKFMCDHFPYFKTAPSGWKNSVRHNLSLNKCFEKIEKPGNGARKGCLWALNPAKIHKMDEEVQKWSRKDPLAIRRAMSDPENLELLERGELKKDYSGNGSDEEEDEDFNESSLTQAQIQARRSRTSSSDSAFGEGRITATPQILTTVSQVHAALHRPADQKIHLKKDDPLEFGTITSVQGNYICTTPGSQTYTLSFSNLGSTTPIIIRRTPVK